MSSLPFGTSRLLAPFLRTSVLSCELKLVLNAPRSLRFTTASNVNNNFFKGLPEPHHLRYRLLHTGKAPPSINLSLQQHGLLRRCTAVTRTCSLSQVAGQSVLIRGWQQVRRLNLPRSNINEWEELQKLSIGQRLKVMFKKYWYIALPLHFAGSIAWFGGLYLLCKLGVNGAKVIAWIQPYVVESPKVPETVKSIFQKDPDSLGNLAVAALLYKLATPARYMTTVFGTFYVVKYLLRTGILIKSATEISKHAGAKADFLNHAIQKNLQKRKLKKAGSNKPPKP